ncbi:MAG TPA: Holliday junction branch migration protein RuvA [Pyrinomonadaceae bacterium]|nr:Holliday junction branch migration protein RuvA [Pyrinomonadaceae bacterium]
MIAYLSGKLLEKDANVVIIDVNGVGYEVSIPLSTFYELGEIGEVVSLRVQTIVREDAFQLFGFKTVREKELFLLLISVSGIGPKSAITALSGMSADEIISAIRTNNLARLNAIPGVGKKTAERIVIELRDKITKLSAIAGEEMKSEGIPMSSGDVVMDDAISALTNLGYQRAAAEKALNQAMQEGTEMSVQKLLRRSLQLLAKG